MTKTLIRAGWMSALMLVVALVIPAANAAQIFVDSSRANVLRQYAWPGTLLVPEVATGDGVQATGSNEGSGAPDQWQFIPNDASHSGTATYTLPGPRLVGSFKANLNPSHLPAKLEVQGLVSGVWTSLATLTPPTATAIGSWSPQTVTAMRYIATGPGNGANYVQVNEFQTFLTTGQTISTDAGYNILRDTGKVTAVTESVTSGPWNLRTGGSGGTLYDGDYFNGHIHGQTGRVFTALTLDQPTLINAAHLGWYASQNWSNYQVYSSAAAVMPAVQSLAATDVATLAGAGWTLQLDSSSPVQEKFFSFSTSGPWRQLLLVWNGNGALVEFEAFLIPEPATGVGLLLGGALLARRRSRYVAA